MDSLDPLNEPAVFKSFILVNIFIILTNLFETFIRFFRKTSVITVATLTRHSILLLHLSLLYFSGTPVFRHSGIFSSFVPGRDV